MPTLTARQRAYHTLLVEFAVRMIVLCERATNKHDMIDMILHGRDNERDARNIDRRHHRRRPASPLDGVDGHLVEDCRTVAIVSSVRVGWYSSQCEDSK
jgi:hypothetical protein